MTFARPYDHTTHAPPTNFMNTATPRMSGLEGTSLRALFITFSLLIGLEIVAASPLEHPQLQRRQNNGSPDSSQKPLSPKIWVPVLIVVLVFFGIVFVKWAKPAAFRKFWSHFHPVNNGNSNANGTEPRELTAEQLAGTINGEAAPGTGPRRARRPRRTRRTPSQISTTSLPAYNKEPGEEELVIYRGRDAEDATMPAAVVMNSVDEDRDEEDARYLPMPTTATNNTPLLDGERSGDLSLQRIRPDTANSADSGESSSLMRAEDSQAAADPDPRGETPAYFEVVDQTPETPAQPQDSPVSLASPPSSPEAITNANTNQNRRSGFRTFLNRMSMHGHSRGDSSISGLSHITGESSSSSRAQHRPTPSQSSSVLSSSVFRTISRQRSIHTLNSPSRANLTSPSLISLNSISSPLPHTLVKTEFTYPRAGPTAEQFKLISSRESLGRFGRPYGADAIAFAASSSRLDLLPPPPDFEASTSTTNLVDSPGSAGPSRLSMHTTGSPHTPEMRERSGSRMGSRPGTARSANEPVVQSPLSISESPRETTQVERPVARRRSSSLEKNPNEFRIDGLPAQAPVPTHPDPSLPPVASVPEPSPGPRQVSEFGNLSLSSAPSAFAGHGQVHERGLTNTTTSAGSSMYDTVRSHSVASVYSYATAAESLPGTARSSRFSHRDAASIRGRRDDSAESEESDESGDGGEETVAHGHGQQQHPLQAHSPAREPSTPRRSAQHELEPTDATVRPANAGI